ncbi:serpin family protein [Bacteroides sp. 51]|uniref:serpin family protein n=1 Tax=Bacteroides sp. 51 TaxID=2302938 RepID=UPI0013D62A6E|nr:serpin family protein [Bacteroides sp. 51]NDV80613.1 serpin family protein [Bacteroides sp. 51]
MKKTILYFLASMLLFSCQSDDPTPTPDEREDIPLSRSELEMTEVGNEFAFDFFKTIAAGETEDNLFISPLSASIALSMCANGAANETLEEMKATLGFKDYSLEEMNAYYKKLVGGLLAVDNTTTLGIANSIWIKKGFDVKQPFIDLNKDIYDAEVRTLDFNAQAVAIINQWCADKTNKRIPKVLDNISPDALLFLINALYFKGTWTYEFDKSKTVKEDFTAISGQKKKVDLMRQECQIPYVKDEGLQVVELPYGNEAFSMIVLLPEEGRNVDDAIQQLTAANWNKWMKALYPHTIDIKLPKFKLEYERDLKADLKNMGMILPFAENKADFSNMSSHTPLFIGLVKQNTFVEVNEEGTEAAAVTIIGMETSSIDGPPVTTVHVNRPFIYIIKEKSTGAILFMGKMGSL